MTTGVHSCLDAFLPHTGLHHVDRDAGGQKQGGVSVPEIVNPDS